MARQRGVEFADLVEEEGAALGGLDFPRRPFGSRPGEGARRVAEKFRLEERLWYCAAVDGNEWAIGH